MADQIVITEKTNQAKDVRAAVGSRYGDSLVIPASETLHKGGHFAARERCPLLPFRSFPRKRTVGSARKGEVMKSVASNADWESATPRRPIVC